MEPKRDNSKQRVKINDTVSVRSLDSEQVVNKKKLKVDINLNNLNSNHTLEGEDKFRPKTTSLKNQKAGRNFSP